MRRREERVRVRGLDRIMRGKRREERRRRREGMRGEEDAREEVSWGRGELSGRKDKGVVKEID